MNQFLLCWKTELYPSSALLRPRHSFHHAHDPCQYFRLTAPVWRQLYTTHYYQNDPRPCADRSFWLCHIAEQAKCHLQKTARFFSAGHLDSGSQRVNNVNIDACIAKPRCQLLIFFSMCNSIYLLSITSLFSMHCFNQHV